MVHPPRDLIPGETGGAEPAGRVLRTKATTQMAENPQSVSETERERYYQNIAVRRYYLDTRKIVVSITISVCFRVLILRNLSEPNSLVTWPGKPMSCPSHLTISLVNVNVGSFNIASPPHHSDRFQMLHEILRHLTSASAPVLAAARPRLIFDQVDQFLRLYHVALPGPMRNSIDPDAQTGTLHSFKLNPFACSAMKYRIVGRLRGVLRHVS